MYSSPMLGLRAQRQRYAREVPNDRHSFVESQFYSFPSSSFVHLHFAVSSRMNIIEYKQISPPTDVINLSESWGTVLAVICWPRAPRGGVTRQGDVLTDLHSLFDCQ
jgi:hypothetical protein